jgi:hypothetical protein
LKLLVNQLTDSHEILYSHCINQKNNINLINNDLTNLRNALIRLRDQHEKMGNLVLKTTYCTTHEFTVYNDNLQEADKNVCSFPIKNKHDVDKWRDTIDDKIIDNKNIYQKTWLTGTWNSTLALYNKLENIPHKKEECVIAKNSTSMGAS